MGIEFYDSYPIIDERVGLNIKDNIELSNYIGLGINSAGSSSYKSSRADAYLFAIRLVFGYMSTNVYHLDKYIRTITKLAWDNGNTAKTKEFKKLLGL